MISTMGCASVFTFKKRPRWRSRTHPHIKFLRRRRKTALTYQINPQSPSNLPSQTTSHNHIPIVSTATPRQRTQPANNTIEESNLSSSHTDPITTEEQAQAVHKRRPAVIQKAFTKTARLFRKLMSAKLEITISVSSPEKTYTTLDAISGVVSVAARSDTPFDDFQISLLGVTKTYVDKLSHSATVTGRSEATHRFLKLAQPIPDLPNPQILGAGKKYQFPFEFVVPSQLLPRACSHDCVSNHLREHHLSLSPSFAEKGAEQIKITYAIEAKVTKAKANDQKASIAQASQKIRIRPTTEEYPPLSVEGDKAYRLRKEKAIRKRGYFKRKNGCLVMEASQPGSFQLPAVDGDEQQASTYARVKLRFDPETENSRPPKLNALSSRLKMSTFYATTCRKDFPKKTDQTVDLTCDSMSQMFSLSSYSKPAVEWTRHDSPSQHAYRPESALSTVSTFSAASCAGGVLAPSQKYRGSLFYTAEVIIPLSLPSKKTFLPTFHGCLVCRTYTLHMSLSLQGQRFSAPVTLKVPVQVSSAGSQAGMERQRLASVAEQALVDAEAAFAPRYVGPAVAVQDVDVGHVETSLFPDMPPGYDSLSFGMGGARNVRVYG